MGLMSTMTAGVERRAIGACSITRLRSRTPQSFDRTPEQADECAADEVSLCFVRRGTMHVAQRQGEITVQAGAFTITRARTASAVECRPDQDGLCELLHLTIPTHMLHRALGDEIRDGLCVTERCPKISVSGRILSDILDNADHIGEQVVAQLVDAILSMLCASIRTHDLAGAERPSPTDERIQGVMRYVDTHLSDPKLSAMSVARGCGISPRYLFSLLQRNGTPFSALVWSKRLEVAGQWLSTSRNIDPPISEIAYRVGFKSPAHFSRMFKREFKLSPRQYRAQHKTLAGPREGMRH